MNIQSSLWFVLSFLLCSGSPPVHCDISSASHYSQKVSNSVLDLYIDIDSISSSTNRHSETTMTVTPDSSKVDFERAPIVPTHIYPYLLLALLRRLLLLILQVPAGGEYDSVQLKWL
ncbi:uncharacterized protein Dmoj_GI26940, isoform A [Drosophila mojavensis]|uniref:Uncharacterized protein, isoform A n=1 Tax=Drosophila mojavensis TaxID=7230 RepID=A0A0Q9XAX7_DROMO|nr:uncharacterized protein Dmoj_GI26940, isoform A [Drosophila mojavensis]